MKKLFRKVYSKILNSIKNDLNAALSETAFGVAGEQQVQIILRNQYKSLNKADIVNYKFEDVGFRKYSQNDEDGILLFLFAIIGTTNKIAIEICASDGIQCNAANLIINHGWQALLFDGDTNAVEKGRKFYQSHPATFTLPPKFAHAWITKDNINELISSNGVTGEIDLLSIDLDGMDYWIWDAINCVSPRVVVVEVQCIWGTDRSVTVPYNENFKTEFINGFGIYSGASINAFISLAAKKNYRLVGFEKYGFNAFFIRNDVMPDIFKAIDMSYYNDIPFVNWARMEFLDIIINKPWQDV